MAGFKEKPKMSSTAGQGQNFKRRDDRNIFKRSSKNLLWIIPSILVVIYFFYSNFNNEKAKGIAKTIDYSFTKFDNYVALDGKQYSVFKIKYSKDLGNRIYIEQNRTRRKLNTLLDKISRDKLTKITASKSIFSDDQQFFAITAAMFGNDDLPPGLLISGSKKYKNINLNDGGGNFYLKPNGVFSIPANGEIQILKSQDFNESSMNSFALQSGPMLVIDNILNDLLPNDSKNINIRSAVGITKDELIFVVSKSEVNFFQLADFMKTEMKCANALHLESAAFAFIDFPGSSFKNMFNPDIEIRNLIIIR